MSAETISNITDRVLPEIQSWKNRPLDWVYPIVWLDAVHYKVMDEKNQSATGLYIMYWRSTPKGGKSFWA